MYPYTASDVMFSPITIDCKKTIAQAKLLMEQADVSAICISADGQICGVFHKIDILPSNYNRAVSDYAEVCKISVLPHSDLSYVLHLIQSERAHSVLVTERGEYCGIITLSSLKADGFLS